MNTWWKSRIQILYNQETLLDSHIYHPLNLGRNWKAFGQFQNHEMTISEVNGASLKQSQYQFRFTVIRRCDMAIISSLRLWNFGLRKDASAWNVEYSKRSSAVDNRFIFEERWLYIGQSEVHLDEYTISNRFVDCHECIWTNLSLKLFPKFRREVVSS